MAPHSSTLAWKIHGGRSQKGYSPRGHNVSNTTEHACIPPVLTELTGETTDTKSKNHTDKYKRLVRPELLKSAISVLRTPEWEPASEGMLALKRSSVAARQKNGLAQRHCWVRG